MYAAGGGVAPGKGEAGEGEETFSGNNQFD